MLPNLLQSRQEGLDDDDGFRIVINDGPKLKDVNNLFITFMLIFFLGDDVQMNCPPSWLIGDAQLSSALMVADWRCSAQLLFPPPPVSSANPCIKRSGGLLLLDLSREYQEEAVLDLLVVE